MTKAANYPGVILAVCAVVLLLVIAYVVARTRRPEARTRASAARAKSQKIIDGSVNSRHPATHVRSAHLAKIDVQGLLAKNAQWQHIVSTLNPTSDATIARALQQIRGPHMFDPRTALSVIEHGIDLAITKNGSNTSVIEGLQQAVSSMKKVTHYGD